MTHTQIIVAGHAVAEQVAAMKAQARPGARWNDAALCAHQEAMSRKGYIEAEIVQSVYGFSVRYASGLQNWGLISPARGTDGSLARAEGAAKAWVAQDRDRRWVTRMAPVA